MLLYPLVVAIAAKPIPVLPDVGSIIVENVNYMAVESINEPVRLVGKIRYSHKGASCVVEAIDESTIKCTFDEPQRAVTPGQSAVFYMDDYVYCGGVIK